MRKDMVEQLNTLFSSMVNETNVDTKSLLVRTGVAVIHRQPNITADKIPLSTFNVYLSENHGQQWMPVVGFPTLSKDTDVKNTITSAIEDFIIYQLESRDSVCIII